MPTHRIILVDDDEQLLTGFKRVMKKEPYIVETTSSPEEALDKVKKGPYALILSDQMMPVMDGITLLNKIKKVSPDTIRILVTGISDIEVAKDAIELGHVFRFITKPWGQNEIQSVIAQAVKLYETNQENKSLHLFIEKQNEELTQANLNLKKLREIEVDIGSKIQQSLLLEKFPDDIPDIEISAISVASQGIDGDFYDFFKYNNQCFDILQGDIMGKGVPAALLGAGVKSRITRVINNLLLTFRDRLPGPEEIITRLHSELIKQLISFEKFFTMVYVRFLIKENKIIFIDCGHTKSFLYQTSKKSLKILEGENVPLGFAEKEKYIEKEISFHPGDFVFLYSDGITETINKSGEFFGEERLGNIISRNSDLSPEDLCQKVKQSVVEFSGSEFFSDDLTCVCVKYLTQKEQKIDVLKKEIQADLGALGGLREFIKEACQKHYRLNDIKEKIDELILAVHEVMTNIIKHAYKNTKEEIIRIEMTPHEDRVVIKIFHHGEQFSPTSVPQAEIGDLKEHGYGLGIITKCVDNILYKQDENGINVIQLIKKII